MKATAALVIAACVLGACTPTSKSLDGQAMVGPCDRGPEQCLQAVALAEARLGALHWPISSVNYRLGLCGPGMRCAEVDEREHGWVIFTFWIGDPVMINVRSERQADGEGFELVAHDPEPVPDWVVRILQPGS